MLPGAGGKACDSDAKFASVVHRRPSTDWLVSAPAGDPSRAAGALECTVAPGPNGEDPGDLAVVARSIWRARRRVEYC